MDFRKAAHSLAKPAEYMAVFYVFLFFGDFMLLDPASIVLAAMACVGIYYAARHRKQVRANLKGIAEMRKFTRANQSGIVGFLANNLLLIYIVVLTARLYMNRVVLLPDHIIFYCLVGALLVGKGKAFIRDWAPLFLLFFAYVAMRGFADTLGAQVHFLEPIAWDHALFGFLPNEALQRAFYVPGAVQWLDMAAMTMYVLHMGMPLIFAFAVWVSDRRMFLKYSGALLLTSYLALVTFMLYPMAPPWMAAQQGLVSVHKVLFECSAAMNFTTFNTIYSFMNSNPVAAMPSLHAAYPILMIVFAAKVWGRKGALLFLLYGIAMWLSLVYLGEHYAIDMFAGAAYAAAGLIIVDEVTKRFPPAAGTEKAI